MMFNDAKHDVVLELRQHLMSHPLYSALTYPPRFSSGEVNDAMIGYLKGQRPTPFTFAFLDPFGYKGLTQSLLHTVLQDFGCDVLFYFAYHPIKRVLYNRNDSLRKHVDALLGTHRVQRLRSLLQSNVGERQLEREILKALSASMRDIDGRGVLTFAFRQRSGRARHHLAFVSKSVRGYQVAKEAMARYSSWAYPGGVPSFEYVPAGYDLPLISAGSTPSIERLTRLIIDRCGGKRTTLQKAYDAVTFNTPYVEANVRMALVKIVSDLGATVYSRGAPSHLRGSRLPGAAEVLVPASHCDRQAGLGCARIR
jgi:three-Cys-motif partner protein